MVGARTQIIVSGGQIWGHFAAKLSPPPPTMPRMQMTDVQAAHIQLIVKRGFQNLKENKKDGVWEEMGDSKPRFRHGNHAVCRFQHGPKHGGGLQAEFYDYGACVGGVKSARRIRGTYGTEKAWQTIVDVLKLFHFLVATDLIFVAGFECVEARTARL